MARIIIALIILGSVVAEPAGVYGQLWERLRDAGDPVFTPLKDIRARAENGVISDAKKKICAECNLKGKLCPKAACKRCQRLKAEEKKKEEEKRKEEAELKKLEAEAKKTELEAKKLEEEDAERNKPWDVADDENLESPSELLQLAAQSKQDQDLAPKKQEALDYLADLGCNKDPKVAAAILLGLKDYNVEVRMVAAQTVLVAVRGRIEEHMVDTCGKPIKFGPPEEPEPGCAGYIQGRGKYRNCCLCVSEENKDCPICEVVKQREEAKQARKQKRKDRRQKLCGRCKGSGCEACGYGGLVDGEPCEAVEGCSDCMQCDACNGLYGCRSCCTEEILEELKKMAFDMDKDRPGCYYEPSVAVRNVALEALTLCPPIDEPEDDPEPKKPAGEKKSSDQPDKRPASESRNTGESNDTDVEIDVNSSGDEADIDVDVETNDTDDSITPIEDEDAQSGSSRRIYHSAEYHFEDQPSDPRLIDGQISKFYNGGLLIKHSPEYMIPLGHKLFITGTGEEGQVVEVVASQAGAVQVAPVTGRLAHRSPSVQIGIMR